MNEITEYLPLGSIVLIKGSVRKIMIVARGLMVDIKDKKEFFDYGGCLYPEGVSGDAMMYFQHKDITDTVFKGYSDDDDQLMKRNIEVAVKEQKLGHADVSKLKAKA